MNEPRILIAGIGNIFMGDDAFGVEVVKRLREQRLPDDVRVVDFGIRGMDLAYALMDDYDAAILIDATQRGREPGTLYVIEPDLEELGASAVEALTIEAHGMVPERVLRWVKANRGSIPHVQIVGCEPAVRGSDDEMAMGLSAPVAQAVEKAVGLIVSLVGKMLDERQSQRILA